MLKVTKKIVISIILFFTIGICGYKDAKINLVAFNYPPFYFIENDSLKGIGVELVDEIFNRLSLDYEIKLYPLKRALSNLETGQDDGIMFLIKTPERSKYLTYSETVLSVRGLIWWAADFENILKEFSKLEELEDYKIGVTRGYSYGNEFDEMLKILDVEVANSDLSNYNKLIAHRIDIFPGNEIVARSIMKQNPQFKNKLVASKNSFIEWDLHMAIAKNARLENKLDEINKIIIDLKSENFIQNTVNKYIE